MIRTTRVDKWLRLWRREEKICNVQRSNEGCDQNVHEQIAVDLRVFPKQNNREDNRNDDDRRKLEECLHNGMLERRILQQTQAKGQYQKKCC